MLQSLMQRILCSRGFFYQAGVAQAGLPYYRLRRTLQSAGDNADIIYVKSPQQECVCALEQTSGNILLTTGSKELPVTAKMRH